MFFVHDHKGRSQYFCSDLISISLVSSKHRNHWELHLIQEEYITYILWDFDHMWIWNVECFINWVFSFSKISYQTHDSNSFRDRWTTPSLINSPQLIKLARSEPAGSTKPVVTLYQALHSDKCNIQQWFHQIQWKYSTTCLHWKWNRYSDIKVSQHILKTMHRKWNHRLGSWSFPWRWVHESWLTNLDGNDR